MALKRVYRLRGVHTYIASKTFPLFDVGCHKHPPCRHNVLVASYEIVGPNSQTPLTGPNKPLHQGQRLVLIPFYNNPHPTMQILFALDPKGPLRLQNVFTGLGEVHTYTVPKTFPLFDVGCHSIHLIGNIIGQVWEDRGA